MPATAASVVMALTTIVDQSFVANLSHGSVSVLAYGTKLSAVIASMLVVIVSTVALPTLTRAASSRDWSEVRRVSKVMMVWAAAVSLAGAIVCSAWAREIVRIVFERGRFTDASADLAAAVQVIHSWHIPFYVSSIVAMRLLVALGRTELLLVGAVLNLLVDCVANFCLVPRFGVVGAAWSTVMMYVGSCILLWVWGVRAVQSRCRSGN
jgi:putative peptidoglycan lipid II flippase